MRIAIVGLGKMGGNMAERLLRGGHEVVGLDFSPEPLAALKELGGKPVQSAEEVVAALAAPRAVWLMIPSGKPVESAVTQYCDLLDAGDILIDGGNSNYRDSMRRGAYAGERGIQFVDCGTSGGIWGLAEGYSMMIGGPDLAVDTLRPVFETLAPAADRGWGHVGPSGSGHYVKMVHNGIEYGLMQAYAEGYSLLQHKEEFGLDLAQVSKIWQYGSVVRSWLLDLTTEALEENPGLEGIAPWVSDSGEGRWTVMESIDLAVPAPVIAMALYERFRSRDTDSFSDRLLAAMRNKFGGHAIKEES